MLVMSPDFVTTPMCEFQTEYALSLSPGSASKKILPVMYRPCTVPPGLKHIAGLYYTRDELKVNVDAFWCRHFTPSRQGTILSLEVANFTGTLQLNLLYFFLSQERCFGSGLAQGTLNQEPEKVSVKIGKQW